MRGGLKEATAVSLSRRARHRVPGISEGRDPCSARGCGVRVAHRAPSVRFVPDGRAKWESPRAGTRRVESSELHALSCTLKCNGISTAGGCNAAKLEGGKIVLPASASIGEPAHVAGVKAATSPAACQPPLWRERPAHWPQALVHFGEEAGPGKIKQSRGEEDRRTNRCMSGGR